MRRLLPFFLCLLAPLLRGQTVAWGPSDSGSLSEIMLIYSDCEPTDYPALPTISGVTFINQGRRTSIVSTNGQVTRATILTYRISSRDGGSVTIPAFTVPTTAGDVRVPAYATAAIPTANDSGVRSSFSISGDTFWEGEVIPITYTLSLPRLIFNQIGSDIEWSADPLIAEEWSRPEPIDSVVNGERRLSILYRTEAVARIPGPLRLKPASQIVNIQTGINGIFGFPRIEQVAVQSNEPTITIRPLPTGAPASFNGAVGDFRLTGQVVPQNAAVGEPITWTLTLEGTGNWPDIPGLPSREVSRDFQVVQPRAKRTNTAGRLFEATLVEDVVLIATQPGTYRIGPVSYTCFDPDSGTYRTLTTDPVTVTVTPGTRSAAQPPLLPRVTLDSDSPPTTGLPEEPMAPEPLPGDVIPDAGIVRAPFVGSQMVPLLAVPFAAVLILWGGLALREARRSDPLRSRREARRNLRQLLDKLNRGGSLPDSAQLLHWQHETGRLWSLSHAAPAAEALPDRDWRVLWEESDRSLYGRSNELPADWAERAAAVLKAHRIPAFSPFRLFLPRNLLPFLALTLALIAPAPTRAAADQDYQAGRFAEAEQAWRAARESAPTNWSVRHNLALSLAQQRSWAEAAAQATAAFVQNPGDPRLVRELEPTYAAAGFTPAGFGAFVDPDPVHQLARLASPATWQLLQLAGSVLLAVAIALGLFSAYRFGRRVILLPLAVVALLAGGALLPAAWIAVGAYGPAADPRAVLVWPANEVLRSIPTDADITQEMSPLGAGSIGIADREFLGWSHLVFPNGQTGWVRSERVEALWR